MTVLLLPFAAGPACKADGANGSHAGSSVGGVSAPGATLLGGGVVANGLAGNGIAISAGGVGMTGVAGARAAAGGGAGAKGSAGAGGGSAGMPSGPPPPAGACTVTMDRVRITDIDLGVTISSNEDEAALKPIMIAPMTSGGSRVAFMGSDGMIHVAQLDASDHLQGTPVTITGYDFSALYADDAGGVLLATRPAHGSGDKHCGTLTNLCGSTASLPSQYACFDMYMVRFDGNSETWATQLTQSSDANPPYLNSPTDGQRLVYIWQTYAHHGRIAFDGTNYAGYYGAAISVSQMCVNSDSALKTGINIHQGDEMRVVGPGGALLTGHNSFDWGCSHSGYERILWDGTANKFVTVCKTDNNNRIAFAPAIMTIFPIDLNYSNLGNIVTGSGGGYWLTTSNIRAGQTAMSNGLADVLLLHFATGMQDKMIMLASDAGQNDRAPHLAAYGSSRLLAAWESSTAPGDLSPNDKNRKLHLQVLDRASGAVEGPALDVSLIGNRYVDFVGFPDGSVGFAAPGSSPTQIKVLRVLPCSG